MNVNDFDLSDRTALVTGSTKGIGFAIAEGLAGMGAAVIVNGRNDRSVDEAITKLRQAFPDGVFKAGACDLLDDADLSQLASAHPDVDILVNNAGAYSHKPFFDIADDEWLDLYRINVLSSVRITRLYLKGMLARGWGRVVNIASESGVFVPPEMIHYGVSKAAQLALSRGIAELTVGTQVTVNSVLPGPTLVETVAQQAENRARAQGLDVEDIKRQTFEVRRPTSLLKRYTTPKEVANMVCYLCSPAASATNGAPVRVDGGIVRTYA